MSTVSKEGAKTDKNHEVTKEQVSYDLKHLANCRNNKETVKHFTGAANRYEKVMALLKYPGPEKVAETVEKLMKNKADIQILDVGAGTGLVGRELVNRGYTKVDALDASDSMLNKARDKNVYQKRICHFVGESPMPIENDSYDVVVTSAAFAVNFMPVTALDEFIRVVRPGGYVINATRIFAEDWFYNTYEAHMAELEEQKKWKLVSRTTIQDFLVAHEGTEGSLHVHIVL